MHHALMTRSCNLEIAGDTFINIHGERSLFADTTKNKPSHVALAELGTKAEKIATSWLSCPEGTSVSLGQVGLSSRFERPPSKRRDLRKDRQNCSKNSSKPGAHLVVT